MSAPILITTILCSGRSGSCLLRNELSKPRDISCLNTAGGWRWWMANELALLKGHATLQQLAAQWQSQRFFSEEIKWLFASSNDSKSEELANKLILKFPFKGFVDSDVSHIISVSKIIYLLRNPISIVNSMCLPLHGNHGFAFYEGERERAFSFAWKYVISTAKRLGAFDLDRRMNAIHTVSYPIKVAWLIRSIYELMLYAIESVPHPHGLVVVNFEDLTSRRVPTLNFLSKFIGISDRQFPENSKFFSYAIEEGGIIMNQDVSRQRANIEMCSRLVAVIEVVAEVLQPVVMRMKCLVTGNSNTV